MQHVKFSTYVGGGGVGVVFEEGEVAGLVEVDDDVNGSMVEVVVVFVACFLPSPPFSFLLLPLLDFIGLFKNGIARKNYFKLRAVLRIGSDAINN
jgi:hypothetical protein